MAASRMKSEWECQNGYLGAMSGVTLELPVGKDLMNHGKQALFHASNNRGRHGGL